MSRKVAELWAWVVVDPDGDEGVLRRVVPGGTQPMIADSRDRLEIFASEARAMANEMGMPLRAALFTRSFLPEERN
jgi:hypothetical protein